MTDRDLSGCIQAPVSRPMTRRELLKYAGLLGAVGVPLLAAACGESGGAASQSATQQPTTAPTPPPPPPPPPAPATPTGGSTGASATGAETTIKVEAYERENGFFFRVDKLVFPAGKVTFDFTNTSTKQNHELWVYPVQDLTAMLALKRADQDADENQYIQGLVGSAEDIEPGKSATVAGTLAPGFYELACFIRGKNSDGSTFVHCDKGQSVTVAATGPSGLTPLSGSATDTVSVVMTGDPNGSWLFIPDRLAVPTGDVTFKVTNQMKEEHDFVVYPLEDVSEFIAMTLKGEMEPDYSKLKGALVVKANLSSGQTIEKVEKLTPGMWAAACFMTSRNRDGTSFLHRDRGQHFSFLAQ